MVKEPGRRQNADSGNHDIYECTQGKADHFLRTTWGEKAATLHGERSQLEKEKLCMLLFDLINQNRAD